MVSAILSDIHLKPQTLRAVLKNARKHGQSASEYAASLIERGLRVEETFDAVLRPVRDDFRKSGMTENELDTLIDRARAATAPKQRKARR